MSTYTPLTNRAILAISGEDAKNFLQGLITNDMGKVSPSGSIYALMLSPQGKFLYDFFITEQNGKFLLDCNALQLESIKKKLAMYKLRSKVVIEDISKEYQAVAIESAEALPDPRSAHLPARSIIANSSLAELAKSAASGTLADYEALRIRLCIPSDEDMGFDKSFPLEFEMDEHNAIDYKKGCYVGQEITARTHYRGTLRKKPYVVTAPNGEDLSGYYGQEITSGEMKVGVLCTASGSTALALLRVEDIEKSGGNLAVGGVTLSLI